MELKQVKDSEKKIGVGVIFIKEDGGILLGKRFVKNGDETFGPPGGHVMKDESTIDAAIRKVKEETGHDLHKDSFECPPFIFETYHKEVDIYYTSYLYPIEWNLDEIDEIYYEYFKNLQPEKQSDWIWIGKKEMKHYYDSLFYPFKSFIDLKMQHKILNL